MEPQQQPRERLEPPSQYRRLLLLLPLLAAATGALAMLLVVLVRAAGGELPLEFSTTGARYADSVGAAGTSDAALEYLEAAVQRHERDIDRILGTLSLHPSSGRSRPTDPGIKLSP
jgi:hypothetical protein